MTNHLLFNFDTIIYVGHHCTSYIKKGIYFIYMSYYWDTKERLLFVAPLTWIKIFILLMSFLTLRDIFHKKKRQTSDHGMIYSLIPHPSLIIYSGSNEYLYHFKHSLQGSYYFFIIEWSDYVPQEITISFMYKWCLTYCALKNISANNVSPGVWKNKFFILKDMSLINPIACI